MGGNWQGSVSPNDINKLTLSLTALTTTPVRSNSTTTETPEKATNVSPVASETDDKDDEENSKDYFEAENPSDDRHRWLALFFKHLNTPDAGRKKNRNRLQYCCQVKAILDHLDPQGKTIDVLAEEEGNIVWTTWVDQKLEVMQSGTLRSYLCTYEKFLQFVTKERVKSGAVPELAEDVTKILKNTITNLKGWRSTIDLESRPKRNQKMIDQCDKRLTTEDVEQFKASPYIVSVKQLIDLVRSNKPLSAINMCEVRDYLIVLTTLKTGTRPGALEKATLHHFATTRHDEEIGIKVILIPDHKRGVAGPAMIPLDEELDNLYDLWVNRVRPKFARPGEPSIFVHDDGTPFTNWTLGKRCAEIWAKSGVRTDLRVTATDIRKWLVTNAHERKVAGENVDESSLRQLMCHSDKTARGFYLREDLTRVAARGMQVISRCTRQQPAKKTKTKTKSPVTSPSPIPAEQLDTLPSPSLGPQPPTLDTQVESDVHPFKEPNPGPRTAHSSCI